MMGPQGFSPSVLWTTDLHGSAIFWYRLSRIILATLAGSALAASGASLQAIFQNPLADPHLFGISGGAALGAALVIAFLSDHSAIMPSAGAMAGGMCAFLIMFACAESAKGENLSHCLLVGVLINAVAASAITLLEAVMPAHKTQSLLFWLLGHINLVDPKDLMVIIPMWVIGMTFLWLIKGELEILSFGFEETTLLGINAKKMVKIAVFANCLLIGNVVAFAGMIGFLGLVVPHLIRLTINPNMRVVLPIAAVLGAVFLVAFDCLGRLCFLLLKSEVPTGALSAVFLSPVLFALLLKRLRHE